MPDPIASDGEENEMKRKLMFLAIANILMAVGTAGAAEKACIDLGRDPFGDRDVMPALVTLVGTEKAQVFAELMATTQGEQITITPDMKFNMEFGNYKLVKNVCVKGAEQATAYAHPVTGEVLVIPAKCRNPSLLVSHRAQVVAQVAAPAPVTPVAAPVAAAVAPAPAVAPLESVSAFDPPRRIEVEAGAGVGVWGNRIAEGNWAYAEALLWGEIGDGTSVGVGLYGNYGNTYALGGYKAKEHGLGVQAGVKQSYKTEDGQAAQWQVKARLLDERIRGSSVTYAMEQHNLKFGLYAENMKKIDAQCLEGWNVEGWKSFNASIKSSWAGDKPQSRDQAQANYIRECRINKLWSWRVTAGPAWTSWDKQFWAKMGVELKYDFANHVVLRFGPSIGVPLNSSATYAGRPASDLITFGFGVQLEYGDYLRTEDAKRRVAEITPVTDGVVTANAVPIAQAAPAVQAVSKGSDPCFTCDNRPGSWQPLQ